MTESHLWSGEKQRDLLQSWSSTIKSSVGVLSQPIFGCDGPRNGLGMERSDGIPYHRGKTHEFSLLLTGRCGRIGAET